MRALSQPGPTLADVIERLDALDAKLDTLTAKIKGEPAAQWLDVEEAAALAERTPQTIRAWCGVEHIGTMVRGKWRVNRAALRRVVLDRLDGDETRLPAGLRMCRDGGK